MLTEFQGNPLLEDFMAAFELRDEVREGSRESLLGYRQTWYLTEVMFELRKKYSFAIPDETAIQMLVALSPIVEIGAGNGYWAKILSEKGADIIAYDTHPPLHSKNYYFGKGCQYFDVFFGDACVSAQYPDRTLFLCWPPYNESMAEVALKNYTGNTLVYIGEDSWGCTGNKEFHEMREGKEWELVDGYQLCRWEGIYDRLFVYNRVNKTKKEEANG